MLEVAAYALSPSPLLHTKVYVCTIALIMLALFLVQKLPVFAFVQVVDCISPVTKQVHPTVKLKTATTKQVHPTVKLKTETAKQVHPVVKLGTLKTAATKSGNKSLV